MNYHLLLVIKHSMKVDEHGSVVGDLQTQMIDDYDIVAVHCIVWIAKGTFSES